MSFFAGTLFFIGLIILLGSLIPLFKDLKAKKKTASPKGLGMSFGGIIMVILAMIIMPSNESTEASEEQVEQPEAVEEVEPEPVASKEEDEKEENEEEDIPSYTEEQETELIDRYTEIIFDSEGLILNIDQEDDYNQIYVRIADEFKVLPVEMQQALIDNWGNEIENNTRSRLYQTGSDDFLYVYFLDGQGNYLADTGHLDRGWTVREP